MNDTQRNDLPSLSVRRPVLILVVNLLIILAGLAALVAVEVRELLLDLDVSRRLFQLALQEFTLDRDRIMPRPGLELRALERLVHARGLFPEAVVANAVFLGRRPAKALCLRRGAKRKCVVQDDAEFSFVVPVTV